MPHVKGHYRKRHWVRPHYRRSPRRSAGVGLGTIAVIIFVLLIIGKMNGA